MNFTEILLVLESTIISNLVITILLMITLILSVLLNMITIISILLMKNFTQLNILITNLAFANLIYSLGIPMNVIQILFESYDPGILGCRLFILNDFIGMAVIAFTVVALSVERFFTIADKKKRADSLSSKFKIFITIVYLIFIWLFAIVFPIPFVLSLKQDLQGDIFCNSQWSDFLINVFFCLKFILIFLIPFLIITLSSIKLLKFLNQLRKRNKALRNTSDLKKSTTYNIKVRRKSSRTVLLIVLLFCIQWLPFWIVQLIISLDYQQNILKLMVFSTTLLAYSNSISNPVLYMLMTYNFKNFCTKLFTSKSENMV